MEKRTLCFYLSLWANRKSTASCHYRWRHIGSVAEHKLLVTSYKFRLQLRLRNSKRFGPGSNFNFVGTYLFAQLLNQKVVFSWVSGKNRYRFTSLAWSCSIWIIMIEYTNLGWPRAGVGSRSRNVIFRLLAAPPLTHCVLVPLSLL